MPTTLSVSAHRRTLLKALPVAAAFGALAVRPGPAQTVTSSRAGGGQERVRMAVGGQAGLCYLPLTVAQARGFFAQEGVQVEILDYAGGAPALQALRQGQADLCCGAFEHVLRAQAQGWPLRSLVLLARSPQLALVASNQRWPAGQPAPARLRIGVSAPGSSTDVLAHYWLAQSGWPATVQAAVQFVGVGQGREALAALRQGRVQALCHSDPVLTLLERRGDVRLLADTRTLQGSAQLFGGPMPGACLIAPAAFAAGRPAQAQAVAWALVRALQWLQTASAADLAQVVPEAFLLGQRSGYLAAFDKIRETLSPDGRMPAQAPATAWRVLTRVQPELAALPLTLAQSWSNPPTSH